MQNALLSAALAMLVWLLTQIMSLSTGVAALNERLPEIEIKASAAYPAPDPPPHYAQHKAPNTTQERTPRQEGGAR